MREDVILSLAGFPVSMTVSNSIGFLAIVISFPSLWLHKIPLCMYTSLCIHLFICWQTSMLAHFPAIVNRTVKTWMSRCLSGTLIWGIYPTVVQLGLTVVLLPMFWARPLWCPQISSDSHHEWMRGPLPHFLISTSYPCSIFVMLTRVR